MNIDEIVRELRAAMVNATSGPWAWKSYGEKCYSFGLGASPYYIRGPKTKKRKTIPDPPISAIVSVYDEFDEKVGDYNEVDFTDNIAWSEKQSGQRDFAFCALAFNHMPAILDALESARKELAYAGASLLSYEQSYGGGRGDEEAYDIAAMLGYEDDRTPDAVSEWPRKYGQPKPADHLVAEVERREGK